MAKSFLAEQINEVRGGLQGLAKDLNHLGSVNAKVLSRTMGVMGAGGPSGGGGGPVLVNPAGQPISPTGAAPTAAPGASSIAEFLRRLGERQSMSTGQGGGGSGTRVAVPPTPDEKAAMDALKEPIEYIRNLAKAANWAGISFQVAIRAPKQERDALIAAWEADGQTGGKSSGGGGHAPEKRDGWHQDENGTWRLDERNVVTITSGDPTSGGGGGGGGDPLRHQNGSGAPTYAPNPFAASAKISSTPTEGDKMVVNAVGGVTKAIEKLASKLDSGSLAFRTKGL